MLQMTALGFERNETRLFSNLSCTLNAGEMLQILGQNGAGKSTLLRLLAGLLQTEYGTLTWQGKPVQANAEHLLYIGHQNGVKPLLTATENLRLLAALRGVTCTSQQLKSILTAANLHAVSNTPASQLSAGQARRLALARLLLCPARLWILDEPLTALDSHGQAWLLHLLQQHRRQQGCVVLATHHVHDELDATQTIQLGETHA